IPVLSYIILGGKCRKCGEHISFRYTLVEIGNMILWLASVLIFRENLVYAFICCAVSSVALVICCIDFEHLLIFDRFQIILGCLGLLAVPFDKSVSHWSHLIGGIAGFGVFWLIGTVGTAVLKKDALGGGDVKLAGVMGLFLGWQKLLLALMIASVLGSVILLALSAARKEEGKEYPFGPFLTLGLVVSMLFGNGIINAYISLF
ncbi:MAG: prepilin peptidase, partial [Firmicutes bacterium]|nr:prepilin peptidase [Candidatus Colimorpha enterica]